MPNLRPSEITEQVARALASIPPGKDGVTVPYATAYQILNRLEPDLRAILIEERTQGGAGAGVPYAAPSVVSDALEILERRGEVEIVYLHTGDMDFEISEHVVRAGNPTCGLYRRTQR